MALTTLTPRTLWRPAKLRRAASSVAPVPFRYERSLRSCPACFSLAETTICSGGER